MYGDHLETVCGCVVGGAGPAGMGFLFNALKSGAMPELAREGLIIVDASPNPGTGRLGDYRITANSVGDVFLDCLRDPALRDVFEPLEHSPAYWRIRRQAQSAPQLADVAELLAEASTLVLNFIVEHYGVKLWTRTTITEVVQDDDEYHVWVEAEGRTRRIRCRALVLNLGGRQDPQHLLDSLADQGLAVPPSARVLSADTLLRMNAVELRDVFASTLARKGRICVVGGSHSAFSVLENLADALEFAGLTEVTLVHRSQIRLFYETAEAALEAGYAFDPQKDVCPVSGRVNRSGGLRYRALDVGREALAKGRIGKTGVRLHMWQTLEGPVGHFDQARQALAESEVVVQCTGYQPMLPVLSYAGGGAIRLMEVKGGLDSDPSGCPLDSSGQRLYGLHLFGLGAGLGVDPRLGSEASFDGRIYGVWQFHNDASGAVIDAVLARLQQPVVQPVSVARRRVANREEQRQPFIWPVLANAPS
ncbi:lysine N(6)-hydroxylase/L-ornithine N(5)-oxygenase family protein [Pseudomonas sp. GD03842]|uniref:pyridine nucleotide-disulfide oxidoreductase n=1 Tax=unclassified Pseudomonas TaxID=196821 RepID=UPI000D3B6228|nr:MULTISPECIES: pyridine nucleotide-disulfide oxidoreductase [unclassified Pseudomonas]MDH0745474.1 lysine N(6)-hydroxylase/L-ornithine N(5)-oxygenase family protein [Pseudomonas sp. GD03842]RAU45144.1 pyridine nucleotide-disulfide oxidoreductase [Pseudomonas sp. RIT 409]RAU51406.1 pyridine nucleotide-disulfide oxidoreductase [Pseudomonas sp. RIT 412]